MDNIIRKWGKGHCSKVFLMCLLLTLCFSSNAYCKKKDSHVSPEKVFKVWVKSWNKQDWKKALSVFTPDIQKEMYFKTIAGAAMLMTIVKDNPEENAVHEERVAELNAIWKKYKIDELGNTAEDVSFLWEMANKEDFYHDVMTVLAGDDTQEFRRGQKLKDVVIDGDSAQGKFVYKENGQRREQNIKFKKIDNRWFLVWYGEGQTGP